MREPEYNEDFAAHWVLSTGYWVLIFHHKLPVCAITDTQRAMRDNDNQFGESTRVPVSRDGHRIRQSPILGSSLTTKRTRSPLSRWFSKILVISPLNSEI